MKKLESLAFAGLLALSAGLAFAQGPSPEEQKKLEALKAEMAAKYGQPNTPAAPVDPNAPASQITFEALSVDFGDINDDKPAIHDFKFTNSGKGTLMIQSVQGSCGCTVPALQKREYAPGESGQIHVEYNPHNRRGKQHTNVTVTSNDPKNPQLKLDINSNVIPQIQIDPPIVNFGQVDRGVASVQTVTVSSRNPELKVLEVTSNVQSVTATLGAAKPGVIDGAQVTQYPIELKVAADAPSGQVQALISIRTSDTARVLTVSGMGEVVGTIAATPNRIQLGGVSEGQPVNTQLRVASRNGKPFKILSIEDVGGAGQKFFTSTPSIVTDNSVTPPAYLVNFSANASGQGSIRGEIVITTDSEEEKTLKVSYFGFIRGNTPAKNVIPVANPAGAPSNAWLQNPSTLIPQ